MLTRRDVIAALLQLESLGFIRAASLGGSDATGRADDLSDIDLFLLVSPGTIESAAAAVEAALLSLSPISIAYRLPMPTWHGFHQAFYQLADAPEHLMIDWVMIEVGTPHPWLEVERHGHHNVLFDKDGIMTPVHVDRAALGLMIEKKVADIRQKFKLFRHLAPKLAGRGLPADSAYFYQALVLRPLVDMLRITHCPDRFDYGFRYLKDDLPAAEYQAVCRWCYPPDATAIPGFAREIAGAMDQLLSRWDSRTA